MFHKHAHFNHYLRQQGLINQIYAAMKSDDYSNVVMAAMDVLEKADGYPQVPKVYKCPAESDRYRNKGNDAFKAGNLSEALECYNRALMYAPKNSRCMKLVYSNRSAIYFNIKQFCACKADIEICFQLGCPSDIISKLTKRLEEATVLSEYEKIAIKRLGIYCHKFFQFDVDRNAQIPCASADIEILSNNGTKKIVAAKDIKIGTLLALEPSYVCCNDDENTAFCCHYCHKMSLNLIPCEGCCFVLFCNKECKDLCLEEFHNIECQIMELIVLTIFSPMAKLMIKGTLKFVKMCKSWKEVNTASNCTGSNRMRVSTVEETFDVKNKLSVLSYNDDQLFIHGNMYVYCFICATIIYNLEKVPSFLPRLLDEKKLAKEALGRLMMYFSLHAIPTQVKLTVSNRNLALTYRHQHINHGWYPFTGKLQNSCTPNVIVLNLNKTAALIAIQPIEKGSELTVSYLGHYLNEDIKPHIKNCSSFKMIGKVCKCIICNGNWQLQSSKSLLTEKQLNLYRNNFLTEKDNINLGTLNRVIPKICEVMTCLNNVPFSKEYQNVYKEFDNCMLACEECVASNVILG